MSVLRDKLLEAIRADGPIRFADYMDLALYDPEHGYYAGGGERTGWRGHFLTSPELDPAFGTLWTRGLQQIWERAGHPGRFDLVEVGPGEGGFPAAVLDAAEADFADALHVTLVEISGERRARQVARLGEGAATWVNDVTEIEPFEAGCVFANEILDNQPVHVLRRDRDGFLELHVAEDSGALVEIWEPCSDPLLLARAARPVASGSETLEVSLAVEDLVAACARPIGRGALVFVDYGYDHGEHTGGSVVTFSSSGVDALEVDDPGERDITAHVDWESVRASLAASGLDPVGPKRQREVLLTLGAAEVDSSLRDSHAEKLGSGEGAAAVRMLSRRQALRALLDPGGLGRLQTMVGIKDIDIPAFLQEEDRP